MAKEDLIEMEGVVEEVVHNDIIVRLENDHLIKAYLAGKLRMFNIKIMQGDKVKVEISPYDLNKGRITWRDKK